MNDTTSLRAVIYARVASAAPNDHEHIHVQIEACRVYAQEHGYSVVGEYQDCGASGNTLDRPGLHGLREAIRRGVIGTVLVYDWIRLARDINLLLFLEKELRAAETSIKCVAQHEIRTTDRSLQADRNLLDDSSCLYCTLNLISKAIMSESVRHLSTRRKRRSSRDPEKGN
jgi:DNA invertase Pin-like site-specific DNA recombinase